MKEEIERKRVVESRDIGDGNVNGNGKWLKMS